MGTTVLVGVGVEVVVGVQVGGNSSVGVSVACSEMGCPGAKLADVRPGKSI